MHIFTGGDILYDALRIIEFVLIQLYIDDVLKGNNMIILQFNCLSSENIISEARSNYFLNKHEFQISIRSHK